MKSKSVVLNLKLLFYIAFAIQAVLFVSFAFEWIHIWPQSGYKPSIGLERYALLITILGIPGALKLFSVIMNKNKKPKDEDYTTSLYIKAFTARFGILFLVASLNILLYALSLNSTPNKNYMLCTLITFAAYIFSYPSINYLNIDSEEEQQESIEEEQHQET